METIITKLYTQNQMWFKSYYVVWKRGVFQLMTPKNLQFKSYYVVWKPEPDGSVKS